MIKEILYNRPAVLDYAKKWAFGRNPRYMDFENLGGDCTSFVSQCMFAGCNVMNYTPIYGWYYNNPYDRSPSWSGVEFLYDFLIENKSVGPYAIDVDKSDIIIGDVVQFGSNNGPFFHNCIVTKVDGENIFVAAHSIDSYMRPLYTYNYELKRFLHIVGARKFINI